MTIQIRRHTTYLVLLLSGWACSSDPGSGSSSASGPPGTTGAPNGSASTPSQDSDPGNGNPATKAPSNSATGFVDSAPEASSNPPLLGNGNPAPSSGGSSAPGSGTPPAAGGSSPPTSAGSTASGGSAPLIRGDSPSVDSATRQGPFQVSTFSTGLRDGPDYGTQTMHVPTGAEPPFAAVAIVPGFLAAESSIAAWGPFLASHGIVTLTIGTNSPTDSPDLRAKALLDALATIEAENTRSGSPLEGEIDAERLGVMGWSMGGGGTLIASAGNPSLKAAITLAAWSPGVTFSSEQVPVLLFAGGSDPVAGGQSQGFFTSIPEATPKMLFEVTGGSHSVANDPSAANGEVGRYGLSWLKVFLEGDERYRPFLVQQPGQASDFRQNLSTP